MQPQCLGKLIVYFSHTDDHVRTDNEARFYAAFIVVGGILVSISHHGYLSYCHQIGLRIRLTCTAMIYKKVYRQIL